MVNRDNLFTKYIVFNIHCYTTFASAAFYFYGNWANKMATIYLKHKPPILNQNNDGPPVNKRIHIRCKTSNNRELRKQDG